jgi:hypothetical protein
MEQRQRPQSKKKNKNPRFGLPSSHPNNPFAGGGRLNFPSLERALAPPPNHFENQEETRGDVDNVSSSPTESLDLSIDARAALHEHYRHVAKYGLDGELTVTKPPPRASSGNEGDVAGTAIALPRQNRYQPDLSLNISGEVEASFNDTASSYDTTPLLNTLDEQWENILQGNNQSIQDFPDTSFHSSSVLPTFDRLQVLNPTAGENEDIEVAVMEMTCIEASDEDDYFNSSKVWQLMTPEKNRGRPPPDIVTQRNQDYSDASDDDNTPDSACMVGSNHDDNQQFPLGVGLRCSISPNKTPPSHSFASSPISLDSLPPDLPPVAAAAANAAAEWGGSPHQKRVASVALTDFSNDMIGATGNNTLLATRDVIGDETGGLHNSLLATSIHEDLPIISTPFDAVVPDPEGSFADWSVQSPEHSFTLPSAVTPIRPLPPLSPIHNVRGSPDNSRPGTTSNSSSSSNKRNSSSSNNVPSRSSARSSTSSSSLSLGRGWRLPTTSMHRSELDFGIRQDTPSPIQHSVSPEASHEIPSSANLLLSLEDAPTDFVRQGDASGSQSSPSPSARSPGIYLDTKVNRSINLEKESAAFGPISSRTKDILPQARSPCHGGPLSSTAAQAGKMAAKYLQTVPHPSRRPLSKSEWPAGDLVLAPTESFESSTVAMGESKLSVRRITSSPSGAQDKDALTAPLVSLDSIDSGRSEFSRCSPGVRSTLSVDGALERRRAYRSVVPRRILFPQDFSAENERGDSFERPAYLPSHSY